MASLSELIGPDDPRSFKMLNTNYCNYSTLVIKYEQPYWLISIDSGMFAGVVMIHLNRSD